MSGSGAIIAIGGGGFTHAADPALEDFCLSFAPRCQRLGYLGWANADAKDRMGRFYARFQGVGAALSHLAVNTGAGQARDWIGAQDLIYLGGGNTAVLLAQLRDRDLVRAFFDANAQGTVIAGVSAGGVCWFDKILSDAGGAGLRPMAGLGLVKGGVCPHYNSEPLRPPAFEAAVAVGHIPAGIAIDDGACVVALGGQVVGHFSARRGSAAYRVCRVDGRAETRVLPSIAAPQPI